MGNFTLDDEGLIAQVLTSITFQYVKGSSQSLPLDIDVLRTISNLPKDELARVICNTSAITIAVEPERLRRAIDTISSKYEHCEMTRRYINSGASYELLQSLSLTPPVNGERSRAVVSRMRKQGNGKVLKAGRPPRLKDQQIANIRDSWAKIVPPVSDHEYSRRAIEILVITAEMHQLNLLSIVHDVVVESDGDMPKRSVLAALMFPHWPPQHRHPKDQQPAKAAS